MKPRKRARSFDYWSQVVALVYGKMGHVFGPSDLCVALQLYSGPLSAIRGAAPPHRNSLLHANRERPSVIGENLFWRTLEHLHQQSPGIPGRNFSGVLKKLKGPNHLVDTTTMAIVANCMDWAKHRRLKATAKTHVRLDFHSLLPSYVLNDTAREDLRNRSILRILVQPFGDRPMP